MKLFGFGKDTTGSNAPKGLKGAAILKEMGEKIKEFVAVGEKDRDEVKEFSSVFITDCDKGGMKPMFSAVGNAKSLIEMLHSAALEDEEFGKILVTASEAAIHKSEELQELQQHLTTAKNFIKGGVKSPEELMRKMKGSGSGKVSIDNISDMSDEEIIALAKKMANREDDSE